MENILRIDTSSGGNGDIWMRLVSFYSIAVLLPSHKFYLYVPPFLRNLAEFAFGDRIFFNISKEDCDLIYTSKGLKDLVKGILAGKKYIAPYHRSVIHDKKSKNYKDLLNIPLFNFANFLGKVQVPGWEWIEEYQGFLDIIGIKQLKDITYKQYVKQIKIDFNKIFLTLNQANIPISRELNLPKDLTENILIFPTGTSRQFIPIWWAKENFPHAYYSFFFKDEESKTFKKNGLKVIHFYREPGDIIYLSLNSKWTVTTDSFPSHVLQWANKKCTVTVTEVLSSRIISPSFQGVVVNSEVPCHPCLHLDRKNHPTCQAGHTECLNWKNSYYTNAIKESVLHGSTRF